jgi:hypothetical protein
LEGNAHNAGAGVWRGSSYGAPARCLPAYPALHLPACSEPAIPASAVMNLTQLPVVTFIVVAHSMANTGDRAARSGADGTLLEWWYFDSPCFRLCK